MRIHRLAKLLLIVCLGFLAVGCASTAAPQKSGSYTPLRHRVTGSNIPQPESIDSANDTMSSSDLERTGDSVSRNSMGGGGGGGGR